MGRAPCCDKTNVKKGPWSPEEDAKLKAYIDQHGTGGNWIALPQKIGLKRCGKSCRLRWLNYLRPNIKHGGFSEEEDDIICSLYVSIGSRWSIIAAQLPGRTDNDIKNYWNTRLKKKLLGKQRRGQHAAGRRGAGSSYLLKEEMMMTVSVSNTNKRSESGHESSNLMVPAAATAALMMNQPTPYWPQLPLVMSSTVTTTSQQDHQSSSSSLRDLLIKLGGRFCNDDHHQQQQQQQHSIYYPFNASNFSASQDHQLLHDYDSTTTSMMSFLASPTSTSTDSQWYNGTASQGLSMNFPVDDDQLNDQLFYCSKNHHHYQQQQQQQQELDELERLYGSMDVVTNNGGSSSNNTNITSAESTTTTSSWEDMNSFVYSAMVSEYETTLQPPVPVVQHSTSSLFQDPATSYFPHK